MRGSQGRGWVIAGLILAVSGIAAKLLADAVGNEDDRWPIFIGLWTLFSIAGFLLNQLRLRIVRVRLLKAHGQVALLTATNVLRRELNIGDAPFSLHLHLVRENVISGVRRQAHVAHLHPNTADSQLDMDTDWTYAKGVIGQCWLKAEPTWWVRDESPYGNYVGCDRSTWENLPRLFRMLLSGSEWERTQRYRMIYATPLPKGADWHSYVGCVSIEIVEDHDTTKPFERSMDRVIVALDEACDYLTKEL